MQAVNCQEQRLERVRREQDTARVTAGHLSPIYSTEAHLLDFYGAAMQTVRRARQAQWRWGAHELQTAHACLAGNKTNCAKLIGDPSCCYRGHP